MKKKNIILIILAVIVGGFVFWLIDFIKSVILVGGIITLSGVFGWEIEPEVLTDTSKYTKNYYIETYGGDLDSNLSVFPERITDDMTVKIFKSSLATGLFDTDGYILLEYTLNQEEFEKDVARLQALEVKIENYDGESFNNKVMYTEEEYAYPAYITIDGYADTYEYALIDEENCRIICAYLAYIDSEEFPYKEYLKLDKSCYDDTDDLVEFSMYTHTFDGGKSYVEFCD